MAGGARWIIDPLDGTVNYATGLPWFSVTVAYEAQGEVQLGLVNAPKAGVQARYVRGALATINDVPARVTQTRTLSDAVISVCLTSHFSDDEIRRTVAIINCLGRVARGVRVVVSGGLSCRWSHRAGWTRSSRSRPTWSRMPQASSWCVPGAGA